MGDGYRAHTVEALPDQAISQAIQGGIVGIGHQLRLYNSLSRRLEDFVPSTPLPGIYSCGAPGYAFPHLGNIRAYVFPDTPPAALPAEVIQTPPGTTIT